MSRSHAPYLLDMLRAMDAAESFAADIVENLGAALEQFRGIQEELETEQEEAETTA